MKKHISLFLLTCVGFWGMLNGQCSAQAPCEPFAAECPDLCAAESACPPRGKVDVGVAFVHVDVLLKGHTVHKMDVAAIKADLNYRVWSGLIVKPTFLFGGGHNDNEIATGGLGVGFAIPVRSNFSVTPLVGYNWGYMRTTFKHPVEIPVVNIHLDPRVRERFRSQSPYVGFELSWTFRPAWRAVFCYQYAWSRTHTQLRVAGIDPADVPSGFKKEHTSSHSHSSGSNISGMIEHDLNDNWSVNLGAAYNNSLSKEKHGLRAWGVKLGLAFWF